MKRITVFFTLLVGASCSRRENDANVFGADVNSPSQARCMYAVNVLEQHEENGRKNGNGPSQARCIHNHKLQNAIIQNDGSDNTVRNAVDPNPPLIPSLMNNSVGLLKAQDIDLADQCFPKPQCDPSAKFRTIDGGCNNLIFTVWGQAHTANTRIIHADYSDGVSEPRKSVSGRELPNVRHIRTAIFTDLDRPAPEHNLFVMQFGQVVAHDTELTMSKHLDNMKMVECCKPDNTEPKVLPKDCLPIPIPPNDPASKKRCLSAPRAADTADRGCQIKPVRQQIGVTSFVDASLLYGSDVKTANSLRAFSNGKLRAQTGADGKSYLPNVRRATQFCNVVKDNTVCYASGDERVNQHPDMAVSTVSLMRLHNVLCDELKNLNPSWDDERLYQEAKRLLIAMYQHVTYNEFLPVLVGKDYARVNRLLSLSKGFDNRYDELLNPTTISSFTSVAYRALHSYIQGFVDLVSEARKVTSRMRLSDFYLRSDIVQRGNNYDSFTRGMLTQHAQGQDQFFTEEVSEFLFKVPNKTDGLDLISLDLARGRDFGEPSYNKFRQLCGLSEAKTFNDFTDQISQKNVDELTKLYEHVDDVDYYAAGMLEKAKPGAILGHTFQCIVGEMFFRWKFGDRFYYEFGDQPGSFSLDQLNEIRKTTLALIVCMTTDIKSIQKNAFDVPSRGAKGLFTNSNQSYRSPLVSCNSIPKLNLAAWRETSIK